MSRAGPYIDIGPTESYWGMLKDEAGNIYYGGVVSYCPGRYAYLNQNKSDTNATLARCLAVYGDAARTYFKN